jgi:hypothetical protein
MNHVNDFEFSLTVRPPLVDTVDLGSSVFYGIEALVQKRISPPLLPEDQDRAKRMGLNPNSPIADFGVFLFKLDIKQLRDICSTIAKRVVNCTNYRVSEKILVEVGNSYTVILLNNLTTQELFEHLYDFLGKLTHEQ